MDTANIPGAFAASSAATDSVLVGISGLHDEDSRAPQSAKTANIPSPGVLPDLFTKDLKSALPRVHEESSDADIPSPRLRSSRVWKVRGAEMLHEKRERKKPLGLLDLPIDVLREIVREVTHTNDLTSLALCHSALHQLAIPHIYSRFDIVWPETNTHAEPRSGVDALTYGLATLVMAEEVFGEAPSQRLRQELRQTASRTRASESTIRRRRGNHYARYTKKFSLGNGPTDWVQEYLITKEGGKMLGTLVALALARMRSLETFIWDMPTGILRDVWMALSSLADRDDSEPCRLQRVWVRWHDNTPADPAHPPAPYTTPHSPHHSSANVLASSAPLRHVRPEDLDHIEHPNFSVLPALKSLSVLDVDELAYLDEMAVLIERSMAKLRELRVGIARHAITRDWLAVESGDGLQQVDYDNPTAGSLTIGEKRLGGVLGILTGLVHDMRRPLSSALSTSIHQRIRRVSSTRIHNSNMPLPSRSQSDPNVPVTSWPTNNITASVQDLQSRQSRQATPTELATENDALLANSNATSPQSATCDEDPTIQLLHDPDQEDGVEDTAGEVTANAYRLHRLQLESLELERVPLSIDVLHRALDWSKLTCLTILHCHNHEALWKKLRQEFSPIPRSQTSASSRRTSHAGNKKNSRNFLPTPDVEMDYPLKLKRIHTNTVSPALIHFLKETLAPNTLEVLFLQEVRSYASSVSIEAIFKGPLRRHRTSLTKLLIDSSEKGPDGIPTSSSRWRRWMLSREILTFICGGKMPRLRELGMAIEYRDWHFFLQRLPSIPHLRSLYIPFLADHVHGADVDPRELALQIVDIVALRPKVEVCYMGIANKCFEILENKHGWDTRPESHLGHSRLHFGPGDPDDDDAEDVEVEIATIGDDEGQEDDNEEDDDHDHDDEDNDHDEAEDDTESDDSVDDGDSDEAETSNQSRLRLREILFYDDKVAVFRARHGRL